jgi:hypothetical protein
MQAALDRIMQTYGMIVQMTPNQERIVREKVASFLGQKSEKDEQKLTIAGLQYVRALKLWFPFCFANVKADKRQWTFAENRGLSNHEPKFDFHAPAVLRKHPSVNGKPAKDALWPNPYLVFDGTLVECMDQFLAKPVGQRHLYEIHTTAQAEVVSSVMSSEHITELARLRDFL